MLAADATVAAKAADAKLKSLVKSLVLRQFSAIRRDPYANAFYADEKKVGEWKDAARVGSL